MTIDKLSEDNVSAGAFACRGHQVFARAPQESGAGRLVLTQVLLLPRGTGDRDGQGSGDVRAGRYPHGDAARAHGRPAAGKT